MLEHPLPPAKPLKAPRRASELAINAPFSHIATWTPELTGTVLIEALRWVQRHGGLVSPRGFKVTAMPFSATLDDHLAEGWGFPEIAGDDREPPPPLRVLISPAEVSRHMAALEWPALYLCPDHIGSARMVGLWAASKARRVSFSGAVKAMGTLSRLHAYRLRDRGLSIISQGLDRDRVAVAD